MLLSSNIIYLMQQYNRVPSPGVVGRRGRPALQYNITLHNPAQPRSKRPSGLAAVGALGGVARRGAACGAAHAARTVSRAAWRGTRGAAMHRARPHPPHAPPSARGAPPGCQTRDSVQAAKESRVMLCLVYYITYVCMLR